MERMTKKTKESWACGRFMFVLIAAAGIISNKHATVQHKINTTNGGATSNTTNPFHSFLPTQYYAMYDVSSLLWISFPCCSLRRPRWNIVNLQVPLEPLPLSLVSFHSYLFFSSKTGSIHPDLVFLLSCRVPSLLTPSYYYFLFFPPTVPSTACYLE